MNEWREKLDRNQRLVKFAEEHPKMTLANIGKVFRIKTRERVRQILRKYGSQSHADPRKLDVKQPLTPINEVIK